MPTDLQTIKTYITVSAVVVAAPLQRRATPRAGVGPRTLHIGACLGCPRLLHQMEPVVERAHVLVMDLRCGQDPCLFCELSSAGVSPEVAYLAELWAVGHPVLRAVAEITHVAPPAMAWLLFAKGGPAVVIQVLEVDTHLRKSWAKV